MYNTQINHENIVYFDHVLISMQHLICIVHIYCLSCPRAHVAFTTKLLLFSDQRKKKYLKLKLFISPSQRTSLHNKDIGCYENITCSSIIMEGWTLKHCWCNPINRTHPPTFTPTFITHTPWFCLAMFNILKLYISKYFTTIDQTQHSVYVFSTRYVSPVFELIFGLRLRSTTSTNSRRCVHVSNLYII